MIIRSVAASPMHGLILPSKGNATLGPLVYKSSAGTVVHARIYQCETLQEAIEVMKHRQYLIYGLTGHGTATLNDLPSDANSLFILGNETVGLSPQTQSSCDELVNIPMANGVESLNVGAAATLVAFRPMFVQ